LSYGQLDVRGRLGGARGASRHWHEGLHHTRRRASFGCKGSF